MTNNLQKGIISVFTANIINLFFSIITNFVLPKILSVETYAAIKTYQMYISYAGLAAIGYIDGMYLHYGGAKLAEINKKEISEDIGTIRVLLVGMAGFMAIIGGVIRSPILLAFSLALFPIDMTSYYKSLFQATGEFAQYGKIINFTAILTFAINMIIIFGLRKDNYLYFLISYVLISYFVLALLERKAGFLTEGYFKLRFSFEKIKNYVSNGIFLLLGNISSILMTGLDRWFVKVLMNNVAFAQYSFAVSMESFLTMTITPVTMTLYNYFCQITDREQIKRTRNIVMIFATGIIGLAFPAKFVLETYLYKYIASGKVLILLFASNIFYVMVQAIYVNLYKAQKKQNIYLRKLITVLIIGIILNTILFLLFKTKEAFAVGTLLSSAIWLVISIGDFKWISYKINEILYLLILLVLFLTIGLVFNSILGFLLYYLLYLIFSEVCLKDDFNYVILLGKKYILKRIINRH